MSSDAAEVLKAALSLPIEARATLVDSLLESLDAKAEESVDDAWREEVTRRTQEIDNKSVSLLSWQEVEDSLRARLRQ